MTLSQSIINRSDLHSRSSGLDSLEDTLHEACAICADAVSTCIDRHSRGDAYTHILDTVYFTVIFVLQLIHDLTDCAKAAEIRHVYFVLQTLVSWIDAIVFRCLYALDIHRYKFDLNKLKAKMAFMSLVHVYLSVINSL